MCAAARTSRNSRRAAARVCAQITVIGRVTAGQRAVAAGVCCTLSSFHLCGFRLAESLPIFGARPLSPPVRLESPSAFVSLRATGPARSKYSQRYPAQPPGTPTASPASHGARHVYHVQPSSPQKCGEVADSQASASCPNAWSREVTQCKRRQFRLKPHGDPPTQTSGRSQYWFPFPPQLCRRPCPFDFPTTYSFFRST